MKGIAPTLKITFLSSLTVLALSGLGLVPGVELGTAFAQGEDDDLLDGDLLDGDLLEDEGKPGQSSGGVAAGLTTPPAELKRKIDAQVSALAARSEAVGDELFVELANSPNANAEIQRRIEEAEERFRAISTQVAKLSGQAGSSEPRAQGPRGYGTPLTIGAGNSPMAGLRNRTYDPVLPVGSGPFDPNGSQQLKWWEKLLVELTVGVSEPLKVLAEKRSNSLKAEGDAISLGTEPRYRPYVDSEVRKAIAASALGNSLKKSGSSNRLSDLLPRGSGATEKPRTTKPVAKPKARAYSGGSRFSKGPMPASYLLPLKRDALTGDVRPMVSLPLGAAAKQR